MVAAHNSGGLAQPHDRSHVAVHAAVVKRVVVVALVCDGRTIFVKLSESPPP